MDATAEPAQPESPAQPERPAQPESPAQPEPPVRPTSAFERFGGHEFFDVLIARFYAGVARDPVLRPMYPEADLGPAAERLQLFLEQYWGGPTTYSETRGHPRLRMRHAPFPVDAAAHDAWLRHMRAALDEASARFALAPQDEAELWDYLQRAAFAMVNTYPGPA